MAPTCIYPGPHSNKFSGEHYLPEGLGRFRGTGSLQGMELLRDRICEKCNNKIGSKIESQFLCAGPTGFFRWIIGIKGKKRFPRSPFYARIAGAEPLYMAGKVSGLPYDLLFEVDAGSEDVYPLRQIIFSHPIAGFHPVPILSGEPQKLFEYLRRENLENAKPVHAIAAPDEIVWLERLIRALGHEPPSNWVTTNMPPQRIQLVVNTQVTDLYFRAIAKIAFHYALKTFPQFDGHEREFNAIKDFIWNGGKPERFVTQMNDQFVANFKRAQRPTHWMHILAVQKGAGRITGYAQFFAGPRSLPPPYQINIGCDPGRILTRPQSISHQHVILNTGTTETPREVIADANPVNHIWLPS